jgi:hypothetical protein
MLTRLLVCNTSYLNTVKSLYKGHSMDQRKDYEHRIECIPVKNTALRINIRD